MADNNSVNRDTSPNVAADDPFAELARIMNQGAQGDTPVPAEEEAADSDPFEVDLEKELLGDLDEVDAAYADEPAGETEFEAADDIAADAPADERFDLGDETASAEQGAAYDAPAEQPAYDEQPAYGSDDLPAEPEAAPPAWQTESYPEPEASQPEPDDYWTDAQPLTDQPAEPVAEADPWQLESSPVDVDESMLAEVDMDFGDLDPVTRTEPEAQPVLAEEIPAQPAETADEATQPAPEGSSASLEDELEMLLAGGSPEPEADSVAEMQPHDGTDGDDGLASSEAFPEPAHPEKSSIFTRANFLGFGGSRAQPAAAEVHAEASESEPAADSDIFMPPAPDAGETQEIDAPPADVPVDFETVDVPEPALAQHDDLELPEIPVEEPSANRPADEFEAEFAYDFPDVTAAPETSYKPDRFDQETPAAEPADGEDRFYAEALGFSASAGAAHGFGHGDEDAAPADADIDRELEAAMAQPDAFAIPPDEKPSRRNGFMIAGAVLGVALLGGIAAFTLSFGGGDTGAPVLVEADDEPMKVKPEDPGGSAAAPNQDSVAYDAATGANDGAAPQQESLVSTTEEPVNVASRVVDAGQLPGVDEDPQSPLDGASGKIEDRLAADSVADSEIADDIVAVQPRKVRTMIVRPDGTLVPREEAAPADAAAATPAEQAPAEVTAPAPVITPEPVQPETVVAAEEQPAPASESAGDETTLAAAETEEAASAVSDASAEQQPASPVTPSVGPVATSRPADQGQAAPRQVAQAAPAATRTQPATPAPVAAASSEWSMQIASQPTAESAQTTYQELARRYGELLGGRGVNIVRAEIPGKGTYYRVRIPTSSRNDGISLCERYKAAGGSCFVSK